jgi:hypothetical protein
MNAPVDPTPFATDDVAAPGIPLAPVAPGSEDALDEDDTAEAIAEEYLAALPMEPYTPPPEAIAELASAALRFVHGKYGVLLDFTSDTLPLVDQYVRDARNEVVRLPESFSVLERSLGAYFGEVLRRTWGGVWYLEGPPEEWRLGFQRVYLATNPIGIAKEALAADDSPGWGAHLVLDPAEKEEIEARLAALPEVDVEEFYLFSTRFDAIACAVAALEAKNEGAPVQFDLDDYEF